MRITKAKALSYAIDVLDRSDWLLVDLLADEGLDVCPDPVQASNDVMEVLRVLREANAG